MEFAYKDQRDALGYHGTAILRDGDVVLEVGDAPRLCGKRRGQKEYARHHFVET